MMLPRNSPHRTESTLAYNNNNNNNGSSLFQRKPLAPINSEFKISKPQHIKPNTHSHTFTTPTPKTRNTATTTTTTNNNRNNHQYRNPNLNTSLVFTPTKTHHHHHHHRIHQVYYRHHHLLKNRKINQNQIILELHPIIEQLQLLSISHQLIRMHRIH